MTANRESCTPTLDMDEGAAKTSAGIGRVDSDSLEVLAGTKNLGALLKAGWPTIALYVALAGAAYPTVVAAVFCVVGVTSVGSPGPNLLELIQILVIVAMLGSGVGLLLATLALLVVLPI